MWSDSLGVLSFFLILFIFKLKSDCDCGFLDIEIHWRKTRVPSTRGLGVSSSFIKFKDSNKAISVGSGEDYWKQDFWVLWFGEGGLIQDNISWRFYNILRYVQ